MDPNSDRSPALRPPWEDLDDPELRQYRMDILRGLLKDDLEAGVGWEIIGLAMFRIEGDRPVWDIYEPDYTTVEPNETHLQDRYLTTVLIDGFLPAGQLGKFLGKVADERDVTHRPPASEEEGRETDVDPMPGGQAFY